MVRHGRDDVPVLLGTSSDGALAGLDLVEGRFLALEPGDVATVFDTDPAAVYFGVQLAWSREREERAAAEEETDERLQRWREAVRLDRTTRWDPVAKPYRVQRIMPSAAPGLHGWSDEVAVFATEQEAREMADFLKLLPRTSRVNVDQYEPLRGREWRWRSLSQWRRGRGAADEAGVVIPMRKALGKRFEPLLDSVPVTGFDEVRAQLLKHRAEVPSVETIRLTTLFAGMTVGVGIAQAEHGFKCLTDLFAHSKTEPPIGKVRDCIWSLGYHQIRERLYSEAPRWAPVAHDAMKSGLRDRALREHLFLHSELPAGISLAKLSFVLALLGNDVVCLDVRILDRMFGSHMASRYADSWSAHTRLSLARYERTEDAFLRGNPFYVPGALLGRARAQWRSWEAAGRSPRKETHATWLDVVR